MTGKRRDSNLNLFQAMETQADTDRLNCASRTSS